jgi:hypothetical protein
MESKNFIKVKKVTLAQQAAELIAHYPGTICRIDRNHLLWNGTLVPTPLSETYHLKLTYSIETNPKTFVTSPRLIIPEGKHLPHVYDQYKQRLCLYYPLGKSDWNPSMYIAHTIVPWASEWLLFYELWLATGEWLGGGIHPNKDKADVVNNATHD